MEEYSILANARKKIKRFKKGKEGATAIEVIGGVLVFLIVFFHSRGWVDETKQVVQELPP